MDQCRFSPTRMGSGLRRAFDALSLDPSQRFWVVLSAAAARELLFFRPMRTCPGIPRFHGLDIASMAVVQRRTGCHSAPRDSIERGPFSSYARYRM